MGKKERERVQIGVGETGGTLRLQLGHSSLPSFLLTELVLTVGGDGHDVPFG